MIIKIKKVYYCEYCGKHNLSGGSIKLHEKHCTANPRRECRMCGNTESLIPLIVKYQNQMSFDIGKNELINREYKIYSNVKQPKIEDISDDVEGCPNCILSIIRQSGLNIHPFELHFDYKSSLNDYWAEKIREDI